MARKTVKYTSNGIARLPDDEPVVYRIQTEGGTTNYVGTAKRGRVQDRLREHLALGDIPGAKVQIQQMPTIQDAANAEARIITRTRPRYNEQGK